MKDEDKTKEQLIEEMESLRKEVSELEQEKAERKWAERLLQALNEAARSMEQALTPEEIFSAVNGQLKELGFSSAVFLTDESQKRLFLKYWSYETAAIRTAEKLAGRKHEDFPILIEAVDVYRKTIREREAVFVEDVKDVIEQLFQAVLPGLAKKLAGPIAKILKVSKDINAPLIVGNKVVGMLSVQSGDLTADDIPAITAFAHQMAAAWHKATLLQDLKRSLAEFKRAEEALQKADNELGRRVEERTAELLKSNEQLTQEITERKKAEQMLSHERALIQTLFGNHPDFFYFKDNKARFHRVSKRFCHFFGLSEEDIIGKTDLELFPEEVAIETYEEDMSVITTGTPIINKEESAVEVWVLTTKIPWFDKEGNIIGLFGISRDITERKKAEEALRESEECYRTLYESSRDGIATANLQGTITECNQAYAKMLGYSREELKKIRYQDITPSKWHSFNEKTFQEVMERGYSDVFEKEYIRKDGTVFPVSLHTWRINDADGNPIGVGSIVRDITERKRAEEALQESERRYCLLANNVTDVIWNMDMNLRYTYISPSVTRMKGWSVEEAMALSLEESLTPASFELAQKILAEELAIENMRQRNLFRSRTLELEQICKDGSTIWTESKMTFLRDLECRPIGISGITRDITERKKAEAERREFEQKAQLASRLATVGEMASGIAHEINNPLTSIIGFAQLLMQKDIPEDAKEYAKIINDGAARVASIIKRLLAFARQQKPERTYVDINQIIETTIQLRTYEMETSNIKVVAHLDPGLPWTMADAGQLQQVFLNIIMNAETEMKLAHRKGKLSIKTEAIDNTIRISFKDNGPGIAKENTERIFDPFFTTKKVGKGIGLGLSICHGIISDHNGQIYARSKLGRGATFIVELPIIPEEKQLELAEPGADESKRVTGAKILVVDDEPATLQLLSQILTGEGHKVQTVDNARDALERINSERYSLILLDIKLPGMSGTELYKSIQKIAQSLARRVVFITGDVLGVDTRDFLSKTKAPYITKPFDIEQLKKDINRILPQRT